MAKKTSSAGKVAAGLGVAALAAGAAAAYYFSSAEGKKHLKQANQWGEKAKAELAKKLKAMKTVSQGAYEQAAKEVLAKYKQAKNIDPKEYIEFGKELKGHWDQIAKQAMALGAKKIGKSPAKAKKRS